MPSGRFLPEITAPRDPVQTDWLFVFKNREILVRPQNQTFRFPTFSDFSGNKDVAAAYFIGSIGDDLCFAVGFDDAPLPSGYAFENLRTAYLQSSDMWRSALSTAVLVVDWDANHKYCGRCGSETLVNDGEWCRKCPSCGQTAFPRISPAIIVAILKEDKILLAHNRRFTNQVFSLIAGFVEPGEFLEDAVHREVFEETGLRIRNVRYFGSQSWPFPDSLMIGFVAAYDSGTIELNEELAEADWFCRDSMPDIPGHGSISRRIIDWYLETEGDGALLPEMVHPVQSADARTPSPSQDR